MTYQDISTMIDEIGIPSAYRVFRDEQELPYCIFFYPENADVMADDTNYQTNVVLRLELYDKEKPFELESRTENILTRHGLVYAKFDDYIESERMYMTTYESEVLING